MMKRPARIPLLLLVLVMIIAPMPAMAAPGIDVISPGVTLPLNPILIPLPDSPDYQYTTSGGKVTITKYTGTDANITIPTRLGGNPVTAIGTMAFLFKNSLNSVVIPEGVTNIGEDAFSGSTNLTSVKFPNSLTVIGPGAFEGCFKMASLTLPPNLVSIGAYAFGYNKLVPTLFIPKNVATIGLNTFDGCEMLTAFTVDPANLFFSSQDGVLYNKGKTTLVRYPVGKTAATYTVPATVKTIGDQSVIGNDFITNMILPAGLLKIGNSAFVHCSSLKTAIIPATVTMVDTMAYRFCYALTSVTFQGPTASIGVSAFGGCTALSSLTLANGLKTILMYAFEENYSLKSVTLPSTLTTLDQGVFSNCINLTGIVIPSGVKVIERSTFSGCTNLSTVSLPSGLTTLGITAFGKTNLTSVSIPASVTAMGMSVFGGSTKLVDARFYGNVPGLLSPEQTYQKNKWFEDCSPSFKIYYLNGTTGWTSPLWNNYPAQSFVSASKLPIIPVGKVVLQPILEVPDESGGFDFGKLGIGKPFLPIDPGDYSILPPFEFTPIPLPITPIPILPIIPIIPDPGVPDPVTPDPVTVPHTPHGTTIIKLYLGQSSYLVNGASQTMDTIPVIRDGRFLLPVRYIAEPLGAVAEWNPVEKKVTITSEDKVIELWLGSNMARVNGVETIIDPTNANVAPILVPPGRTMMPFRFIGENLGCQVDWNGLTSEATLTLIN